VTPQQPREPRPAAYPSWALPICCGAAATCLITWPALQTNVLWLGFCFFSPLVGGALGMVPASLALRREPWLGAGSGFAVAFIAVGLGSVPMVAATLLRGFAVDEPVIEALRSDGFPQEKIDQFVDTALRFGPTLAIVGAGLLACAAGVIGAVLAGWVERRLRRRAPPPAPQ
jgi:predicted outer membrane lipoprotein